MNGIGEAFIASLHLESMMWSRFGMLWRYGENDYYTSELRDGDVSVTDGVNVDRVTGSALLAAIKQWRRNNLRDGFRKFLPLHLRRVQMGRGNPLEFERTTMTIEGHRMRYGPQLEKRHAESLESMKTDCDLKHLLAAKPFLDAYTPDGHWRAFALITIQYRMIATGKHKDAKDFATEWLAEIIQECRDRYKGGFHANPFGERVLRER